MVFAIQGCLPRSLDEFIHLLGHCGRQRRLFECEVSSSPLLRFWPPGLWVRLCLLSSGWGTRSQGSGFAAAGSSPPPLLWSECVIACHGEDDARHAGRNHALTAEALAVVVFIVTSVFNNRAVCNNNRCVETGQSSPSGVVLMGWGRECSALGCSAAAALLVIVMSMCM